MKKHQSKNLQELELHLTQEWNNNELSVLEKLVDSVASRSNECVKMKGYPTKSSLSLKQLLFLKMNCVSLPGRIIFRYEKFMSIFSFFRKIKIERNTKLKLIASILGITCYKMSLIEAPNVAFHKAKKKERKELYGLDGQFFDPLYLNKLGKTQKYIVLMPYWLSPLHLQHRASVCIELLTSHCN